MSKNQYSTLKKKLIDNTEIPEEIIQGLPIISMKGKQEIVINNYRGILEFSDNLIRIQSKIGLIKIIGSSFKVEYYNNDEMKISGNIISVVYE